MVHRGERWPGVDTRGTGMLKENHPPTSIMYKKSDVLCCIW